MPIWSKEINPDSTLQGFAAELAKDTPSKGSFVDDFAFYNTTNKIVVNPYITVAGGETLGTACRIGGCAVDLASWRAALLACSTVNSPIIEIAVTHCTLTSQHLTELASTLEKIGNLQVLKLDYITFAGPGADATAVTLLRPFIWGASAPAEYLSLRGNSLGDTFCTDPSIYQALSGNFTLQSLNLADNQISDVGATELLRALRLAVSIKQLSLSKNSLAGGPALCKAITDLLCWAGEVSADDETSWKSCAKVIADKNKALKDINKKRKKGGYAELPDVATPPERIIKADGVNVIANRFITDIDFSFNPLDEGASLLPDVINALRGPCPVPDAPQLSLRMLFRCGENIKMALDAGGVQSDTEGVSIVF